MIAEDRFPALQWQQWQISIFAMIVVANEFFACKDYDRLIYFKNTVANKFKQYLAIDLVKHNVLSYILIIITFFS